MLGAPALDATGAALADALVVAPAVAPTDAIGEVIEDPPDEAADDAPAAPVCVVPAVQAAKNIATATSARDRERNWVPPGGDDGSFWVKPVRVCSGAALRT